MRHDDGSSLERFVLAVRRRMIVVRGIERVGVGTLVAMIAAAPLITILIYRGESSVALMGVALLIGASAGSIWGMRQRPTILHAASEADRQLDLNELLS